MKRHRMTLVATVGVALLFLLTMGAPSASADTLSIDLGSTALGPYPPGPYGTVEITLVDSTHANIVFQTGSAGQYTYFMVGSFAADLNVNGTFSVSSLTANDLSGLGFSPPVLTIEKAGNVDGFRSMFLIISEGNGFSTATDMISFTLTGTGGGWSSASDVLTPNSLGFLAGMHIGVCDTTLGPCSSTGAQLTTGFAVNRSRSVPDGGMTVMLLGGALIGLATLRRSFRA